MSRALTVMFLILAVQASTAYGQLDLDQEVLIVPDTHNEKPYIWHVVKDPEGYEIIMNSGDQDSPVDGRFSFKVRQEKAEKIQEMHVFITDSDLHIFRHLRPVLSDNRYSFSFFAPKTGMYRFEIVLRTEKGWLNLKKDIMLKGVGRQVENPDRDKGYGVKVKLIPQKVYAEHVVTFLFELTFNGEPIKDIEKVDGTDMQFASWDEDLQEFIYVTPKQNFGGPEVAVSAVFMRPGKRAVFTEFRHNGEMHGIDLIMDVLKEPPQVTNPQNPKPSDK